MSVYNYLIAFGVPNFSKATETLARTQIFLNQAQIVCALERYRKAHGQYPEALTQLVPQFIEKLPIDVITGGPLQYRRTEPGRFTLYSVGWNEKDDGGVTVMSEDKVPKPDFSRGDWVWMWPVK